MTYDLGAITRACAKKMNETLHMLIQAIWTQSTILNQSNLFEAHEVNFGPKFIHLVQIKDLGPNE